MATRKGGNKAAKRKVKKQKEISLLKWIAIGEWFVVFGSLLTAIAATVAVKTESEDDEEDAGSGS
ncbi:MAG TPA: hypothetical protein VFV52_14405 [Bacilli bacterium]|nr:hypothetical protein [Bacilli bacterium]